MRSLRRPSDDDLPARAARGDGAAFVCFYRRYVPGVLAFMARRTADAETAGDVAPRDELADAAPGRPVERSRSPPSR